MAAAITELRNAVKATVAAEFAAEGFEVVSDKLHDAVGTDRAIAAVFPEGERPHSSGIVSAFLVSVQVFARWDPQIDPNQRVDPALIEGWAWRLQRRINPESAVNSANLSYYVVNDVIYPDDPTGNKTRFVMGITGYGHSPSLGETSP
jgi:hypothetical protein